MTHSITQRPQPTRLLLAFQSKYCISGHPHLHEKRDARHEAQRSEGNQRSSASSSVKQDLIPELGKNTKSERHVGRKRTSFLDRETVLQGDQRSRLAADGLSSTSRLDHKPLLFTSKEVCGMGLSASMGSASPLRPARRCEWRIWSRRNRAPMKQVRNFEIKAVEYLALSLIHQLPGILFASHDAAKHRRRQLIPSEEFDGIEEGGFAGVVLPTRRLTRPRVWRSASRSSGSSRSQARGACGYPTCAAVRTQTMHFFCSLTGRRKNWVTLVCGQ